MTPKAGLLSGLILLSAQMFGQTPTVAAVFNAASYDSRLCPGLEASVAGSNFGSSKTGVTVNVGGKPGFIGAVTPTQINFQIPFELSPGPTSVVVQTPGGSSASFNITLSAYAPALFSMAGSGSGPFPGLFSDAKGLFLTARGATPGQPIVIVAAGLGQTNPASATGVAPSQPAATTSPVTITVNKEPATIFYAGAVPNNPGGYQINFNVPSDLPNGVYPVAATIGGVSSNTVTLTVTSAGPVSTTPTILSLDNGASFVPKSTAAPGTYMTLKGANLGSIDNLGVYPATESNGVSVTINGVAAPLFDLIGSEGQINLLAPSELPSSGTVPAQVKTANGMSSFFTLTMAATVPAMFGLTDPGKSSRRNAIAVAASTGWIAMPVSMAEAIAKSIGATAGCAGPTPATYCGHPVNVGDTITLYATGLGIATPNGDPAGAPLVTGQVPPVGGDVIYQPLATPVVTIGGVPVPIASAGLAQGQAGVYQINLPVPAGAPSGDDVPITLSVDGSSTDTATIAIR